MAASQWLCGPVACCSAQFLEVPIDGGLDALAAYVDGSVRYINHAGKILVLEGVPLIATKAKALVAAAQAIVNRIGPWEKPRLPPPKNENFRMTFLVSDGLYFGEGPFAVIQRDPLAAPVVRGAAELLRTLRANGTE